MGRCKGFFMAKVFSEEQRTRLLQGIADGLGRVHRHAAYQHLDVVFTDDTHTIVFVGAVGQAIDYLVNDITWDENGSWEGAVKAYVVHGDAPERGMVWR